MSDERDLEAELRQAMEAEADRARPDPDAWSAIERRRADRRPSAWRWGALAVAAVAVVALIGVLAWPRDDRDEVIVVDSTLAPTTTVLPEITVAPTTSAVPTTSAPTTPPTTAPTTTIAPSGRPTLAVAVTEDGRLVVLDTSGATAVEVRELDRGSDPRIVPEEGETAILADPALSPNGRTVYYSRCCEPVVGALFSVAVDGSSPPVDLGYGTFPVVSPSGDRLALVQYDTIVVRDLATGAEQTFPDTGHEGTLIDLAWGADEQSLLYVRSENLVSQLVRLDVASGSLEVLASTEAVYRFPSEGDDAPGTVVLQCCADGFGDGQPASVVGLDGATIQEGLALPLRDRRVHGDFELRVDRNGMLSWVRSGGAVGGTLGGPFLEAAW